MDRGIHIVLADDEADFLFSASVLLRRAGYRVTVAADGGEAFARILEARDAGDPVQVLVTDQQMPGLTGTELVGFLRDRGIRIPVVVVTACRDLVAMPEFSPGGIREFIEKPIGPEHLLACLKRVAVPEEFPT